MRYQKDITMILIVLERVTPVHVIQGDTSLKCAWNKESAKNKTTTG